MSEKEKLNLLEEIMELDENTLSPDDGLEEYAEWDSISGKEIKEFKLVSDALNIME